MTRNGCTTGGMRAPRKHDGGTPSLTGRFSGAQSSDVAVAWHPHTYLRSGLQAGSQTGKRSAQAIGIRRAPQASPSGDEHSETLAEPGPFRGIAPEAKVKSSREKKPENRMGSELHNLYWQLRSLRKYEQTRRRLLYRRIKEVREKIIFAGADPEEIRLLCRYLANTRNKHAERAYLAYRAQMRLPFV